MRRGRRAARANPVPIPIPIPSPSPSPSPNPKQVGGARGAATSLAVVGAVTYITAHEVARRGRASPYAAEHITVARATLDLRAVIHTDWEGLGALHALLLQLESDALDGAAVVGPDGVEVPACDVPDKLALDAILRSS